MQQHFAQADLFMFTSLRDTFGTVNFEALAKGCPVICLNHHGVGGRLPDAVAIKVPATTPQAVVHTMARHINSLAPIQRGFGECLRRPTVSQQLNYGMIGPC